MADNQPTALKLLVAKLMPTSATQHMQSGAISPDAGGYNLSITITTPEDAALKSKQHAHAMMSRGVAPDM